MKTMRNLFLLCAGLSLFACSSDDDATQQFPEGTGMVEVKVLAPQSRAVESASGNEDILVAGEITITLYADFVASDGTVSVESSKTATITAGETAKFWNVKNPTKVTASVNGGQNTYATTEITTFNPATPIATNLVPAYGEVEPELTSESSSPNMSDENKDKVNANDGDQNKTYQMYEAEIEMKIPLARLEVSNLKLSASSKYATLHLEGVYLDHIYPNGPAWEDGKFKLSGSATDYAYDEGKGTGVPAILKDEVDANLVDNTLPTNSNVYAYYFYGAPEGTQTGDEEENLAKSATYNPSFKMYFDEGTVKQDEDPSSFPRYAFIKRFKDGEGKTVVLENGYIYKVVGINTGLEDENIIGDESGNTLYGVEVTVVQARWQVKEISADWAE